MTKFYSITTRGFYPAVMRADYDAAGTWPADAAITTSDEEIAIHAGLAAGGTISGTSDAWIVTPPAGPTLAQAQAAQLALISAACQAAITGGIASSALGSARIYPTKPTDQINLSASIVASLIPGNPGNWTTPLWCADANGEWAFIQHTAAQVQKAGQDVKAAIIVFMGKNLTLSAQVTAAISNDAVQAASW